KTFLRIGDAAAVIVGCKPGGGCLHHAPAGLEVRGVGLDFPGARGDADVRVRIAAACRDTCDSAGMAKVISTRPHRVPKIFAVIRNAAREWGWRWPPGGHGRRPWPRRSSMR